MSRNLANILNKKSGRILILAALLAGICFSSTSALAINSDPERFGKVCEAGSLPALTHDANCSTDDCKTREGCLDAAPAAPINRVSSDFGPREDPTGSRYTGKKGHGAIDFAAPKGSPIYAAGDGIVQVVKENPGGYGNYVMINHDNGYTTLYGHMNCYASYNGKKIYVKQRVIKGQIIGFVGSTGASTGPHLHYEVRSGNTKKDPHAKEMQGVMCKVPDQFAKAEIPNEGLQGADGSSADGSNAEAGCSSSGCAKMYPADNISELHHKYEAAGNPCAFNNCAAGDIGGCSYGSSQLECNHGSMKNFLTSLQKSNPNIWQQLGGGTVDQMNSRACQAPATDFANKWKGLCSTSQTAINDAQEAYMKKTYYDTAANAMKDYGLDFNNMSAELQMSLFSASVALGSPGGVRNLMKSVKNNIGDPSKMTESELLAAMYERRDYFYSSSSEAIRKSVQNRNAREGAEALESLKIREAMKADPNKTYEQAVKEVTGKEPCAPGSSAKFNCTTSGVSGSDSGVKGYEDKTCSPSEYKSTYGHCMFCPLFEVVFNTASKIAKLSYNKLAPSVLLVVLIAWALWLAMQILTFISSMETKDAPTLLKTILNKSFVVLIVVIILKSDSSAFFSLAMEPIFNTGFRLAQFAITEGGECTSTYNILQDGGLPASMGTSILCTIEAIQGRLMATMSLGAASMCVAFYVKAHFFIFPSLPYLITGLLIWCGAGIVILIFPFLMLDAIFQLTVACALLPAAIGAYPFKYTNKYVKHVWNAFLNAVFNFIFLSIIILILTSAIKLVMEELNAENISDDSFQDLIVTTLVWGSVAVVKIVFVLLLAWVILEEANGFANQFAPSMTKGGIGSQIGGLAAGGAKKLGVKAWGGAKTVGSAVGETIKEKAGDMRRGMKMRGIENAARSGKGSMTPVTDKDGNIIGHTYEIKTKSWARGRNKTQTVTIMNNGAKMLTTTKDYGNGKIVTTKSDGYLKQTETSVNGKVTASELSIETAGMKAMRNRDGSMNMTALNAAIQGSAFSEKMVKAAALQQFAQQSFPTKDAKFKQSLNDDNINITTDEQGREVLEVVEKNSDGTSRAMRLTLPTDGESNRAIVELEKEDTKGNKTSYATDGMVNRLRATQKDPDTGEEEVINQYSLSEHFAKRNRYAVGADGEFTAGLTQNGGTAFSEQDQAEMKAQFKDDRIKGKQHKIAGIV